MVNRINLLEQNEASEKSQELLGEVQKKFGSIPNVFKMMANSSAVLQSYLSFSSALSAGKLDPKIAERIALLIAQDNGCEYCLAAHSAIAKNAGLSEEEIMSARQGISEDKKANAALDFVIAVVDNAGKVEDSDIEEAREAGFSDEELLEMVAAISLNILTNSLNNLAHTKLDFPKAKACEPLACSCGCSH